MALICLVTLEVERDGKRQEWRDKPDAKDWDLLAAQKQRDGYTVISHRREFVEDGTDDIKDQVELAGAA